MHPRHLVRIVLCALLPGALSAQAKAPVSPEEFGRWESLGAATLSPDGRWLAYALNRVSEENELRIRGVDRDTTVVVANAAQPVFSGDSRWVAYEIAPSPAEGERLEREKKPVRSSVGIRDLAGDGAAAVVADVSSFRFSGDGRFLAMRGYPAEGKRTADLYVQDLARGTRLAFGNVSDFAWSDGGALLALSLETEGGTGNAVQVHDAAAGSLKVLDASGSLYRALAWREKADDLAVLRTLAPAGGDGDTAHVVLAFRGVSSPAPERSELDPGTAPGFPAGMRVTEHRRPEWAADGSRVYLGVRPREAAAPPADSAAADAPKPSDVQVWHSRDVRIVPMQKAREREDEQRALLAVWHLGDGLVGQIGTDLLEATTVLEGDRFAIETDRKPYGFGVMFGRPFHDVWLIDLRSGERRRVLERVRYFFGASPTGQKLLWYDGKDYWSHDVGSGERTNLTASVAADFSDPGHDYPADFLPPSGVAGWAEGDGAVLVHDEFDLWSLAPDGSGGRRLTGGAEEGVVHRYARTRPDEEGIDLSRPVYLSLHGKRSKKNGYARLLDGRGPERLVFEDARVYRLQRADSAEVFAFTRERFDDSPDWFAGGGELRDARRLSETNPFQEEHAWGRAELIDFRSAAGLDLQGVLLYPAGYDASRKYPMIVYTYERLSQNLHNYVVPSERSYYNLNVFTANGYFVMMPDIVYRGRDPGVSALEAVVPAVRAVVSRGMVDSTRVGLVGHSWGGYQATFLPTRTDLFAASVAGAPITNFLSFPGAVHWETGQARMGVPYWEDLDAYLRNSPAARVHELRTPMLMMFGDADGTVDWHQGIEFYNFARRAGREDFVLLVYPGEDHGLRKKENQIDYHRRILQWFGHWLKGDPAPEWMTEGVTWAERKATLKGAKEE